MYFLKLKYRKGVIQLLLQAREFTYDGHTAKTIEIIIGDKTSFYFFGIGIENKYVIAYSLN